MSLVAVPGGILRYPDPFRWVISTSNLLLDATGEKYAALVHAPKTGTLGKVRFPTGTVTTGGTIRVSFQDDSGGDPDGTEDQYRDVTVDAADDNTWKLSGLITDSGADGGAKRSVTKGDPLWIVCKLDGAGSMNLLATLNPYGDCFENSQYVDHYTASWSRFSATFGGFELLYDDDSVAYTPGLIPTRQGTITLDAAGAIRETGNYFQVPFACKVAGMWWYADQDASCDLIIYDSDGTTELASTAIGSTMRRTNAARVGERYFSSEVTLAASTWYRAVLQATSGSQTMMTNVFSANAAMGMVPGGINWYRTDRDSGGTWSQTDSQRIACGLLISQIHDGAGGSGLLTHPGMSGRV